MNSSFYKVLCGDQVVAERCEFSPSLFFRFKGLLGRSSLDQKEGIWLKPCNSIHMFFMKFSIDAVFLDRENRVLQIYKNFSPWRATPIVRKAHSVLELKAGDASDLQVGSILEFTAIDREKS